MLLVRHAQSEWNADGRWQGWADPPLSPAGAAAAHAARAHPALDSIDAVASSDLARALTTAELLAAGRDWPGVLPLRGLRERGAGDWTGLTRAEIEVRWPGALAARFADIPGGESVTAVTARAVAALHRIAEHHPGRSVLAISHGALIRGLAHHLGATPEHLPNLGGLWVEVGTGRIRPGEAADLLGVQEVAEQSG